MAEPDLTRYFFHLRDDTLIEDPDGSELRDLDAARTFALCAARELWAAAILRESDLCCASFEITNQAGDCLAVVPFTDALSDGLRRRLIAR